MDAGEALELAELDRRLRVTAQQVREAVRRHLDEEAVLERVLHGSDTVVGRPDEADAYSCQ
jgi:hypothetical protein